MRLREASDVSGGATLQPSDFTIGKGEILGVTGLIGSGYAELPYLLFGAKSSRTGSRALRRGNDAVSRCLA